MLAGLGSGEGMNYPGRSFMKTSGIKSEPIQPVLDYRSPSRSRQPIREMGPIEQKIQIVVAIVVVTGLILFVLFVIAFFNSGIKC
jgi:hypothetical protein